MADIHSQTGLWKVDETYEEVLAIIGQNNRFFEFHKGGEAVIIAAAAISHIEQ
jgi:hypothetical protein